MLAMMLIAHLIGDYVLQFNALVRWKTHSLWGVLAHGTIVTTVTVIAAITVQPAWWTYALLIGVSHTLIDIVRARLVTPPTPGLDLLYFLLDQIAHLSVIASVILWSQAPAQLPTWFEPRAIALVAGLLFLLQPAWVLLRFLVRGVWGESAAPPLGSGEKYFPMLERVAIALLALTGMGYLIPIALLPGRIERLQGHEHNLMILIRGGDSWIENMLSILFALGVGLGLRYLGLVTF
ncbi:MAG: hypothetical protein BWY63_03338 [Chloroflexi bacterium ADurb.Bin360]|nr:MAG: hypothetical protein BWY63_03338 [Chloroflexi bacterium ADurb.Bin360]